MTMSELFKQIRQAINDRFNPEYVIEPLYCVTCGNRTLNARKFPKLFASEGPFMIAEWCEQCKEDRPHTFKHHLAAAKNIRIGPGVKFKKFPRQD
jgi:hypothetical protein